MPQAEVERQLVVFSLHGEHSGLPITSVREIIRYIAPSATAVPSGVVQGMINLRGQTLPVVDISSRLGRQLETSRSTRILVVEVSGGSLGLIVVIDPERALGGVLPRKPARGRKPAASRAAVRGADPQPRRRGGRDSS
jgi:CheW-like domain